MKNRYFLKKNRDYNIKKQYQDLSAKVFKNKKMIQEYVYTNEMGDAQITVCHIFPGVELAYVSAHMMDFDFGWIEDKFKENYLGIHYCKEGRIEQEINQEFFYLLPGDCFLVVQNETPFHFQLPLKHFHGISIGIDLTMLQNSLIEFLENCGISPLEVMERICGENSYAVLHSVETLKKFFEEVYNMDKVQDLEYLRIKLPELFYQLKYIKSDKNDYDKNLVPRTQVEFVKRVADYISQNINEKLTIKKLTMEFGISDTYLQNTFRNVYGMPVISFIRVQKMQSAAQVLIQTTRTIDEIAQAFGYENESKFSSAFKKIMGDSPGVYRREHSKIKIT